MRVELTSLLLVPVYVLVDSLVAGNDMSIIPSPHANLLGAPLQGQLFLHLAPYLRCEGLTLRLGVQAALVLRLRLIGMVVPASGTVSSHFPANAGCILADQADDLGVGLFCLLVYQNLVSLNLGQVAHLAASFRGFRGQVTAFIHQGGK